MSRVSKLYRGLLYLFCLVTIVFYVYLQVSHFLNIPEPYQEPDSLEFLYPESVPYAWGSVKPPFVPFIYKLLGRNIELIVVVQLVFSLLSWIFLAYASARSLRSASLIPVAFICILGLGLSDAVSMWNKSILSESFSLSLLACFTGAWLLFLRNISFRNTIMLIIIATSFVLTRTANGFLLLMLAGILILGVILNFRSANRNHYLAIICSFLVLFLISDSISNTNNRWTPYFLNVLSMRILTNHEMLTYFEDHGMPVTDSLMERAGKWSQEDDFAYYKDPDLEEFRKWLYSKGKSTYALYLLTHPAYTMSEPLHDLQRMIFSTRSRLMYYAPKGFTSPLQGKLFDYLSAWSLFTVYVFLTGILWGLNLLYAISKKRAVVWVPLVMIFLVYPLAALTWHADAMEIERHALPVAIQARLGFILLVLFLIDTILYDRLLTIEKFINNIWEKKHISI